MAYTKTTWVNGKTPINADNLNKIENQLETLTNLQDQLLDIFYPIGSYYETSDTSFDPNVTWGGTWVEDSKGRVTVALDDSDADFNTISKTGGSKYLQRHNHIMSTQGTGTNKYVFAVTQQGINKTMVTEYSGKGDSGNLQPYIVVRRWHRTS